MILGYGIQNTWYANASHLLKFQARLIPDDGIQRLL